jgi:hypothetical protein
VAYCDNRSIAIDHLLERAERERAKVAYVYFDYKTQKSQTRIEVICTLVKQLLSQSNVIPDPLEELYKKFQDKTKPMAENMKALTETLQWYGQIEESVFMVFDALDECSEHNRKDVLELLSDLVKYGYKVLVSSRPHVSFDSCLQGSEPFRIQAHETDLNNYVSCRLDAEKKVSSTLRRRCIELTKDLHGM